MQAKITPVPAAREAGSVVDIILKAVPLAMGVAVVVTALLGQLDMKAGFCMLGIGMAGIGAFLLKQHK